MSFNIKALEDLARDVDPDLRYMALEDFQKNLNNPKLQVKDVATFIPVLFKLLHDPISEVQNQAIMAFAPLVRHIDDAEIVNVIGQLYSEADTSPDQSRFTTSLPNLALRSIFQNSHARFGKHLSRVTIDSLLPRIVKAETITLSRIEILIDLIKSLGSALVLEEILAIRSALMLCAFTETGIVSKRAIVATDVLLVHVKSACSDQLGLQQQFYNTIFTEMIVLFQKNGSLVTAQRTFYALAMAVLAHVGKSRFLLLSQETVDLLFSVITEKLQLFKLEIDQGLEDLDIDLLAEENLLRDQILTTLGILIPCISYENFIDLYLPSIVAILEVFVDYDPLATQKQDDIDTDDEEIDFSDDDEIEQADLDGSDGLASKLRTLALVALGQLLANRFLVLKTILKTKLVRQAIQSIGDETDYVSNEAISVTVTILRLIALLESQSANGNSETDQLCRLFVNDFVPLIETQVFDYLLTPNWILQFSYLEVLIETLISTMTSHLSANFLTTLFERLKILNISLNSHSELIGLYEVMLKTYSLEQIPDPLLLVNDLTDSLSGQRAYSNFLSKYLQVCKLFYSKKPLTELQINAANDKFFVTIAERVNSRQFSGDVRQQLLGNLSELLIQIPITEENKRIAVETFTQSLNYEVTVSYTIECLNQICEHNSQLFDSLNLSILIIEKLSLYLGSGDSSLYGDSLILIQTIFERTKYTGDLAAIEVLCGKILEILKNSTDPHLLNKASFALGYIMELRKVDGESIDTILDSVAHIISLDTEEVQSQSLEFLAIKLSENNTLGGEELCSYVKKKLDLSQFNSAKFLAIVVKNCQLVSEVSNIENTLLLATRSNEELPIEQLIFSIHFIGCVCSESNDSKISYNDFLSIIKESPSEPVSLAAAKALGLSVFSNFDEKLPLLLECFQKFSEANDSSKTLLLVSIKQMLKQSKIESSIPALSLIWDTIVGAIANSVKDVTHSDVAVLKLVGEILSMVTLLDSSKDYQLRILQCLTSAAVQEGNDSLVYIMIVVTKLLLSDSKEAFDEKILEQVVSHLPKQNLDLKLAIVSTILTGVYNKSRTLAVLANDVILPLIFDELSAKEEFKKVIPMGPYKYVVDEGLEVRKLSYELINAMINVNDTFTQEQYVYIDRVKVIEQLLAKGLNDTENDVICLAAENLIQIIQNDHSYLTQISNLYELTQALAKVLSRNLRGKATTQETESHGDTLRAIIKLSKVINSALVSDSALTSEWSNYYNDLKTRHQLLFHATI